MNHVVPPSLLFDFQLGIPQCAKPSRKAGGRLLKLPDSARLFVPSSLNETDPFAAVSVGWNSDGLAVSVAVDGKPNEPTGSSADLKRSDCVFLWIDTRPAGNVHRATEYCHHFACLPADDHQDSDAAVIVQPIAQQRSQRVEIDPRKISCRTVVNRTGYVLDVWFPGDVLHGYRETADIGKLGFYCVVQDSDLGDQPLSVGDDFPTSWDPSTWLQLDLLS